MKKQRKILLMLTLLFFGSVAGQALAGGQLATAGERLGKTCASCHGTDGASPGKLIPIIGGQQEAYLGTVMAEFATDKRPASVMSNLAKGYETAEQLQLSAFFAAKPWVNTKHAPVMVGTADLVKSCRGCHGAKGQGQGSFPRLAGQHPEYLLEALLEYKDGGRKAGTMALVKGIDQPTLKGMADYFAAEK